MTNPWNQLISGLPAPHLLQSYEWGELKGRYGWIPLYAVWDAESPMRVENRPEKLSDLPSPVAAAALILKK